MKPILFHLFQEPIYSYPLMMGLGWGIGFNITLSLWLESKKKLSDLLILFLGTFLFGWIGAKVFFLIFSMPERAIDYAKEFNFWFGGGFVFYGGLVGALIFASIFTQVKRNLAFSDLGLITPGLAIGHSIGRLGCVLAGCCYGSQCDLPIAIVVKGVGRYPVQIFEIVGLIFLSLLLFKIIKTDRTKAGPLYLIGYSIIRFINEFFRGDEIRGIYSNLSTSQWVSLLLFILGIFLLRKKQSLS